MPFWLLLGVYVFPLMFCWFTLQRGYSDHVRRGAFLLAGFTAALVVVRIVSPY